MKQLKLWWKRRQLAKAESTIESYGLSIVKLVKMAGTTYIVKADGSYLKLVQGK